MKANILHVVPVAIVLSIGFQASSFAQAPPTWIGIELEEGKNGGVRVHGVMPGSPAAATDLTAGDEVMSLDGGAVRSPAELRKEIGSRPVGKRITLAVRAADGKMRKVVLAPAARPSDAQLARGRLLDKPGPELALKQLGSSDPPKTLAAYRGHPLLVDFWATWCGPCVHELPALEQLRQRQAVRGLQVIGISTETEPTIKEAIGTYGIKHPILVDESEKVFHAYGIMALPTLVLLDKDGVVRAVEIGGDLQAIEAALKRLDEAK
jgi:thiol-disulfide isomerase/thioredoxin